MNMNQNTNCKAIKIVIAAAAVVIIAAAVMLRSSNATASKQQQNEQLSAADAEPATEYEEEYSHSTIIISCDEAASDSYINELCAKYGLTVLYDYTNFSMYALSTGKDLSDQDLNALIADLSSEEHILGAQKDYIMSADGQVFGVQMD